MALARDHHRVLVPRGAERELDRASAVDTGEIAALGRVELFRGHAAHRRQPDFDVREDRLGVFGAGIVTGRDGPVAIARHRFGHRRPFFAIAVAPAAEHRDEAPRRERAHRREQLVDGVGRVGVVDEHGGASITVFVDAFETPRNLRAARDSAHRIVAVDAEGLGDSAGDEQVVEVEVTEERAFDVHAAPGPGQRGAGARERGVLALEPEVGVAALSARHPDDAHAGSAVSAGREEARRVGVVDVHDGGAVVGEQIAEQP